MIFIINFCIAVMFISALLAMYRLFKGPHILDRVLTIDFLVILIISLLGLLAMQTQMETLLDIALFLALLSSIMALAFTRYPTKKKDGL